MGLLPRRSASSTRSATGRTTSSIDSTLEPGSLTYGECVLPGEVDDEVLLTTHVCHPVARERQPLGDRRCSTELASRARGAPRRLSYRFLFIPGTIGSIAWLARNEDAARASSAGLVLACVGDSGAADVQAQPARRRARRPGGRARRRAGTPAAGSSTSFPGAGTSGSSTRRASTCRSAA